MMIISFARTTPALLAGRKIVTRRYWTTNYAARFVAGDCVQAYDKNPRNGGKRVAFLRILSVELESLSTMSDEDYEAEGFAFLGRPFAEFQAWRNSGGECYVVRFEVVNDRP